MDQPDYYHLVLVRTDGAGNDISSTSLMVRNHNYDKIRQAMLVMLEDNPLMKVRIYYHGVVVFAASSKGVEKNLSLGRS